MSLRYYINRPRRIFILGVFLFSISLKCFSSENQHVTDTQTSENHISYTAEIQATYFLILDLKMKQAEKQLAHLKQVDPQNYALLHLENLKDFLEIFINEEQEKYNYGLKAYSQRIQLLNKSTINSPYRKFITAEIHLQWGLIHAKYGSSYKAFIAIKKAYRLLHENKEAHPDFLPNYKSLGILHAALSIIPPEYQWGLKFLTGMEGDLSKGVREIEYILKNADQKNFLFYRETLAMYLLVQLYLANDPEKAWELIKNKNFHPEKEPLICFAYANTAMRTGRNDLAIHYLENRPQGAEYMPFPYLNFMLGEAYLRKLDKRAIRELKTFVKTYPGHNYIKVAYQKIAWYNLIFGKLEDYHHAMDKVLSLGTTYIDSDVSAERDAKTRLIPQKTLLKAQLLFDGGYYDNAYSLLLMHSNNLYESQKYGYEYTYRLARVLHKMKQYEEAIVYYKLTYQTGRNRPEYYACNAALQLGTITEIQGKYREAAQWYNSCLQLSPATYATGIHRDAQAGLERIGD